MAKEKILVPFYQKVIMKWQQSYHERSHRQSGVEAGRQLQRLLRPTCSSEQGLLQQVA